MDRSVSVRKLDVLTTYYILRKAQYLQKWGYFCYGWMKGRGILSVVNFGFQKADFHTIVVQSVNNRNSV